MLLNSSNALENWTGDKEMMSSSGKHFQNLRNDCVEDLEQKRADCSSKHLLDVPQDLNPDIKSLDLHNNNLTIMRNTSFLKYLQLTYLNLGGNSIRDIESGAFYSHINLALLILAGNANLELRGDIFQWSCALNILLVSACGLSGFKFVPGLKDSNPQHATTGMDLDDLHSKSVDSCTYYALDTIDLTENNIRALTNETFSISWRFYQLYLEGNPLHRVDPDAVAAIDVACLCFGRYPLSLDVIKNITIGVAKSARITRLSITSASITFIPPDLFDNFCNKTLSSLDLQGNNLILYPFVFASLNGVSNLNLQDCNLLTIDPRYFEGMDRLGVLWAKNNIINSINPDKFTWNVSLYKIELGLYQCREIKHFAFKGLDNLATLYLKHAYTSVNEPNFLISHDNLQEFTLLSNSAVDRLKPAFLTLDTPHLKYLHYEMFYHVSADLNAMQLLNIAKSIENVNFQAKLGMYQITLKNHSVFWNMHKLTLLDLSQNLFDTLPPAVFKNLFSLRNLNLRNNQIRSIASDAIVGLTSLEILELQENELINLPSSFLISLTSLIELKLDFNILSYLDEDVFVSATMLTTLTMSNNHLVGFNRSTFDPLRSSLKSIDISGNSLVCDCQIEWLVEFFNGSSPNFLHKEDTFCSPSSASLEPLRGKPFATFEYDKYCGLDTRLILEISGGVFAIFVLSISFIISYHYRWFLGYKLFLLKLAILGYNEIQDGRDQGEFEYDINVMFVDGDEDWATNILRPELDRRFPTFDRIAFGDDDLILGKHYFDAVYYNVEKSFKTILLLSRAAVQDHIFMTKFRIAMNHVTDTETENLILVFLEDIPDQELPYLVRLHLGGQGAYLHWEEHEDGQEYFWNKLTKYLNINLRVNHMIPPE